jgi:hypothetical protein
MSKPSSQGRAAAALKILAARIAADSVVTEGEAMAMRFELFPDGMIDREEAEVLLRLNARVRGEGSAWRDAFVEALTDHVLHAEDPAGHLGDATARWLETRILNDDRLDRDCEMALIVNVLRRAETAPAAFAAFVRDRIFQLLTSPPPSDLGAQEVELIRTVLFAEGGSGSIAVSRDEAEWLFAIDSATDGGKHHESWRDLFVKAICNHLMAAAAPALLDRTRVLHRARLAKPAGVWGAWRTFAANPRPDFGALSEPSPGAIIAQAYEKRVAEMRAAERLTLDEIAWVSARVHGDRRVTANERAVLEELKRIADEQGVGVAAAL